MNMPHLFFGVVEGDEVLFDEHETRHMKVVRVKPGDVVNVTDGLGGFYLCEISTVGKRESRGKVLEKREVIEKEKGELSVVVPHARWERMRFLVEKCVELGVDEIVFYRFERSQMEHGMEKIEMVVRDAAKQCVRYVFPKLRRVDSLEEFADENTLVLELGAPTSLLEVPLERECVRLVVGPEGGFSEREKEFLSKRTLFVSLGKKILRFETAALLAVGYVALKKGKI